jgi:DNA modification methylase
MINTVKIKQRMLFTDIEAVKPLQNNTDFRDPSFSSNKTLPIHRWVPWVAGFSRDFVKSAIERHLTKSGVVLDTFAGVGTTLIESVVQGHKAIGFEINPYAALACETKLRAFKLDAISFETELKRFKEFYFKNCNKHYVPKSEYPKNFKTRGLFYSDSVLKKVLIVLDFIQTIIDDEIKNLFRIAFSSTMIGYSNYSYEPSLGQRKSSGKPLIEDFQVGELIAYKLKEMLSDIELYADNKITQNADYKVYQDSFFNCQKYLDNSSIDLIITSPPYLNNYHYNRNTRPQLYWLDLVRETSDMKELEERSFGKYWQTVRGRKAIDLEFKLEKSDLHEMINSLREMNNDRGVYGGLGWANYAATYFNDCYYFSKLVKDVLKRKGTVLVVIGNNIIQGKMFETEKYLAQIMESVGLEYVDIHIPRATRIGNSIINSSVRVGKAKKEHSLYEAVVEMRKK